MKQKPKVYLTNKELLEEVINCKKTGIISNKLGSMFIKMVNKYGTKGNFCSYTYLEDMKSNALLQLCKTWQCFDDEKYSNAFAFYTQCIHNQFLQELKKEKLHQHIRDEILVCNGLNPSYSYQEDESITTEPQEIVL